MGIDLHFCTQEEKNFVFKWYIFNIRTSQWDFAGVWDRWYKCKWLRYCFSRPDVHCQRGLIFNKTTITGDAKSSGKEYLERKITRRVYGIEMIDMF